MEVAVDALRRSADAVVVVVVEVVLLVVLLSRVMGMRGVEGEEVRER